MDIIEKRDIEDYLLSGSTSDKSCLFFIYREASRRGLKVTYLSRRSISRMVGPQRPRYHRVGGLFQVSDAKGNYVVLNKTRELSKTVIPNGFGKGNLGLRNFAAGISAPKGINVPQDIDFEKFSRRVAARELTLPLVVKPLSGSMGRGVSVDLRSLKSAYEAVKALDANKVRVEEFVQGIEYRVYLVGGKFKFAAKRYSPAVRGDGQRSIGQLIDKVNAEKSRLKLPKLSHAGAADYVERQGKHLDTVLADGESIQLAGTLGRSSGGTIVAATDELTSQQIALLNDEIGAHFQSVSCIGIDLIISEHGELHIIEVNTRPQLSSAIMPDEGQGVDLGAEIVAFLFPGTPRAVTLGAAKKGAFTQLRRKVVRDESGERDLEMEPSSVFQRVS